jgi:hypothetical protein
MFFSGSDSDSGVGLLAATSSLIVDMHTTINIRDLLARSIGAVLALACGE